MPSRELKNKPLVEALIEVKWALTSPVPGVQIDPHYKLLLGRFYDKVYSDYPEHEQLPSATMPDELIGYMVQHRFRSGPGEWPLIQIGPGILTLNDTDKYTWSDFRHRSINAINRLFKSHPKPSDLTINSVLLRYIDAVEFDYKSQDLFAFLVENMQVTIRLPDSLFNSGNIERTPQLFNWQAWFGCRNPQSLVCVRFAIGQKESKPALVWEILVQSQGEGTPTMPEGFAGWIDAAHALTDEWFFKLIEGQLERRFSGD